MNRADVTEEWTAIGRLLINLENKIGLRIELCGTPDDMDT